MPLDGELRDCELGGDLPVALTRGHVPEHLALAFRETGGAFDGTDPRLRPAQPLEQHRRQVARNGSLTLGGPPQRAHERDHTDLLPEDAVRPGGGRLEHLLVAEVEVPEDDGRRTTARYLARGLDTTRRRQIEVDKHDVRTASLDDRDELLECRRFGYFEVALAHKNVTDSRPKDPQRICDDDPHGSYVSLPARAFSPVSNVRDGCP